jgi:hypothetical protein
MTSEAKPFASLGPTLLARKGGARPAMRSQLAVLPERVPDDHHEDLGWNDMGEHELGANDLGGGHTAEVLHMNPANEDISESAVEFGGSEIRHQQDMLAARFTPPLARRRAPVEPRRSALDDGRRAAFTLRVDAERHLKLRLACTIRNRSAQQLVTEALDKLLSEMPDLDTLANQVKRK